MFKNKLLKQGGVFLWKKLEHKSGKTQKYGPFMEEIGSVILIINLKNIQINGKIVKIY